MLTSRRRSRSWSTRSVPNNNLPPLKLVSSLTAAARYHAMDMADDNYFNHESMDRPADSCKCMWHV